MMRQEARGLTSPLLADHGRTDRGHRKRITVKLPPLLRLQNRAAHSFRTPLAYTVTPWLVVNARGEWRHGPSQPLPSQLPPSLRWASQQPGKRCGMQHCARGVATGERTGGLVHKMLLKRDLCALASSVGRPRTRRNARECKTSRVALKDATALKMSVCCAKAGSVACGQTISKIGDLQRRETAPAHIIP